MVVLQFTYVGKRVFTMKVFREVVFIGMDAFSPCLFATNGFQKDKLFLDFYFIRS